MEPSTMSHTQKKQKVGIKKGRGEINRKQIERWDFNITIPIVIVLTPGLRALIKGNIKDKKIIHCLQSNSKMWEYNMVEVKNLGKDIKYKH